ncbi:Hypothetical predicted protein [Xyrichtys novacula]|uniref:Uncharacterized protein n=1 Tax=Xyrichtys novacula TaxID=13765 RepID=A0AAV1HET5_XYRNO|nr:Hypothetical predicted protein [Xyrichtys novacula]
MSLMVIVPRSDFRVASSPRARVTGESDRTGFTVAGPAPNETASNADEAKIKSFDFSSTMSCEPAKAPTIDREAERRLCEKQGS